MNGRFGQADDGKMRLAATGSRPVERAGLGVGVEQENAPLFASKRRGEMDRQRSFADSSLLIEYCNDLGHVPS